MTTETVTGSDVVRAALKQRRSKGHYLSHLAKELDVGIHTIDAFIDGAKLPPAIIGAIARDLFGQSTQYDEELDMLRRQTTPAKSMGSPPPPFDPLSAPYYYKPGQPRPPGPRPLKPEKPAPKQGRPGWLE